jgi:hypothetical protein
MSQRHRYNELLFIGTLRVFRQKLALEDAIGSHACSIEAIMRVSNGILSGGGHSSYRLDL